MFQPDVDGVAGRSCGHGSREAPRACGGAIQARQQGGRSCGGAAGRRRGHAAAPSWPSEAKAGQREGLRACGGRVQARRRGQAKLNWGHQGGVAGMRQRRLGAASIMAW